MRPYSEHSKSVTRKGIKIFSAESASAEMISHWGEEAGFKLQLELSLCEGGTAATFRKQYANSTLF
jgi:hypothetical protein